MASILAQRLDTILALARDPRLQRAIGTSITGGLAAALTLVAQILTIPVLLQHLGDEAFGMLMTLYSMVALFAWTDLGVGWAVVNRLAGGTDNSERSDQRAAATTAVVLCSASGVLFGMMLGVFLLYLRPPGTLNVPAGLAGSFQTASCVLAVCAATSALGNLSGRIHASQQRGYIANLWDMASRTTMLVGVLAAAASGAGITSILAIMCLTPCVFSLLSLIVALTVQYPWLRPSMKTVNFAQVRLMLSSGAPFCVLQAAAAIGFSADALIIAQISGPGLVDEYVVFRTPFAMIVTAAQILTIPLWPAYREALSRDDRDWARRIYYLSLAGIGVVTAVVALLLVAGSSGLFAMWVGRSVTSHHNLFWGLGTLTVCVAINSANSMLLNAAGILRFQVITAIAMAVVGVGVKVWLFPRLGLAGIAWGGVGTYLVVSVIPCLIVSDRWLRRHAATPIDTTPADG